MQFDSSASRDEHNRKKREYYLRHRARHFPNAKSLETLRAEALAKTEKTCTKCGATRPMDEFPRAKQRRDGRDSHCRACMKVRSDRAHQARSQAREALNPKEIFPEGQKRCRKCGTLKPYGDFPPKKTRTCKQCACDYTRAAYLKDPEKAKAASRNWWRNHPEMAVKNKESCRKSYLKAHPDSRRIEEVIAAKEAKAHRTEKACKKCGLVQPIEQFGLSKKTADGRQYQCKACMAERERKYYADNQQMLVNKAKKWSKANPDVCRQIAHVRRARIHGIPGSHTLAQWKALCAKFQNRCVRCGKSDCKLTRDHIVPVSNPNSSNDISNIQPLCYSCNSSKNNRSIDYRKTPFINSGQQLLF